jgi:hypothetical protein
MFMRTPAQIEASRQNGSKSKGPITAEGIARSSQNAIKHGLSGYKLMVIEGESPQEWQENVDEHVREYQPETKLEFQLMIEIAAAAWRLRRSKFVETAMFDLEIGKQRQQLEETHDNPDQPLRHASAMMSVGGNINLLERYETRAGRAYDRAVRNFDNLRARRRKSNDDRAPQTPLSAKRPQEESQPCE